MKQTDEEIRLAEFRALREESWRLVRDDLARLKSDVGMRGVGERIRDRIGEEAHEAWDYTRDVASEHRGIVVAMIVALVAWALREPIAEAFGGDSRDAGDNEQGDDA
ncbi:MAG: hypothetical protein ABW194_01885 [Novosphingobium sp.]